MTREFKALLLIPFAPSRLFRTATYRMKWGSSGLRPGAQPARCGAMPSKPIPGSSGEVLTCLPSPYIPHAATGLLYFPRFLAKCRYVKVHGALPASYAKNFKRGLDRFLCMHLGIDPATVAAIIMETESEAEQEAKVLALLPSDVQAAKWNRELVQKGMTPAGQDFLKEALGKMGCEDRASEIKSVPDLIDFDEGRID